MAGIVFVIVMVVDTSARPVSRTRPLTRRRLPPISLTAATHMLNPPAREADDD